MSGPFKMKGFPTHAGVSPMKSNDSESVSEKVTKKTIEGVKKGKPGAYKEYVKRKARMKAIRDANPDAFEKRVRGHEGEPEGGTWTHKKSGKTMKDYYDTGETLPTVEVKGKKSPVTKKSKGRKTPGGAKLLKVKKKKGDETWSQETKDWVAEYQKKQAATKEAEKKEKKRRKAAGF